MNRELLVLGMLREHEMHGYQLNEFIDAHLGTSIDVKKATLYQLLGKMQERGWVSYHEEQIGNYPTRRVYAITANGEEAFQRILRENLAEFQSISFLNNIGFVYLDDLPQDEATALLELRRKEIIRLRKEYDVDDKHQGGYQRMVTYQKSHLEAELRWLDEVIGSLMTEQGGH